MEGTNVLTVNIATMNTIIQAWVSAKFTGDVEVIGLKKTRGKDSFEITLKSPDLIDVAEETPDRERKLRSALASSGPAKKAAKKK